MLIFDYFKLQMKECMIFLTYDFSIFKCSAFFVVGFLRLRNFYYDLILHNRRPKNQKNCWSIQAKCFSQNAASPTESKIAKLTIPLTPTTRQAAVFEKFVPSRRNGRRGEETMIMNSLALFEPFLIKRLNKNL